MKFLDLFSGIGGFRLGMEAAGHTCVGFPDWAFERAKAVNSDSQLYKQAGNSVTVPLVAAIARQLI